jgi:hypothetical protein
VKDNQLTAKKPYALIPVLAFALFNTWITRAFVLSHDVYYNLYRGTVAPHRLEEFIGILENLSVWGYVLAPGLVLLQITVITLIIQLPLLLKLIDVPFSRLLFISSISHIPLCLLGLCKSFWLMTIPISHLSERHFAQIPLALTRFLDYEQTAPQLYAFLGNCNLFTLGWLLSLILGLVRIARIDLKTACSIVFLTWLTLLTFQYMFLMYFDKIG